MLTELKAGPRVVSVEWADAMREVGAACGIAVGAAVAALVRE